MLLTRNFSTNKRISSLVLSNNHANNHEIRQSKKALMSPSYHVTPQGRASDNVLTEP